LRRKIAERLFTARHNAALLTASIENREGVAQGGSLLQELGRVGRSGFRYNPNCLSKAAANQGELVADFKGLNASEEASFAGLSRLRRSILGGDGGYFRMGTFRLPPGRLTEVCYAERCRSRNEFEFWQITHASPISKF